MCVLFFLSVKPDHLCVCSSAGNFLPVFRESWDMGFVKWWTTRISVVKTDHFFVHVHLQIIQLNIFHPPHFFSSSVQCEL